MKAAPRSFMMDPLTIRVKFYKHNSLAIILQKSTFVVKKLIAIKFIFLTYKR